MYQLTGTKGFANKYPVEGYALKPTQISSDVAPDHEDLSSHGFVPENVKKALMEKYKHPIQVELEEQAKKVGGSWGNGFYHGLPFGILLAKWASVRYGCVRFG